MSDFITAATRAARGGEGAAKRRKQRHTMTMRLTDEEIEAIAYEAFTVGRVYANTGEKEPPAEIHVKLMLSVGAALGRHRQAARKRRRADRAALRAAPRAG